MRTAEPVSDCTPCREVKTNDPESTGSSASAAPSASDNSSALSDALSVEPAHSTRTGDTDSIIEDSHDENETVDDTILASGEDDMSDVGGHVTFDCLYCAKAYATSQGLKVCVFAKNIYDTISDSTAAPCKGQANHLRSRTLDSSRARARAWMAMHSLPRADVQEVFC